jgi:hypothetical protein
VAAELFNTVKNWLKEKGVTQKIIGPVNFSTNEPCGLLIEGFDSSPVLMIPITRLTTSTW